MKISSCIATMDVWTETCPSTNLSPIFYDFHPICGEYCCSGTPWALGEFERWGVVPLSVDFELYSIPTEKEDS